MPKSSSDHPWKRLFDAERFGWSFRMRPGDAQAFFAPSNDGGALLEQKRQSLASHPGRYLASIPGSKQLIASAIDTACSWGHLAPGQATDLSQLAHHWEPDILLVGGEELTLQAACVCMPSSWSLEHAIGKPVHAIHDAVPRLNPALGAQIDRFLRHIPQGKGFTRENWSLTRSDDANYHPALGRPKLDASVRANELFLRLEHQMFTAIPGGILMGIRIETTPLSELRADPETWNDFREIIHSMPDDVARYKSMLEARDVLAADMAMP